MRPGESNPNWRGGVPAYSCLTCGGEYRTYEKGRKFCSLKCRPKTPIAKLKEMAAKAAAIKRAKPRKVVKARYRAYVPVPKDERKRVATFKPCVQCGAQFKCTGKRQIESRRYCSYPCHLASGGAQRAGDAAAMAKTRYGAKKDANHKELVDALEYLGASVVDLSAMGCGIPDLLVHARGIWHLCDVKNKATAYGRRGLNPRQIKWASEWKGGPVVLLYSIDDAKALIEGRMDALTVITADEAAAFVLNRRAPK